jgi:hypothetical protein
MLVPSTSTITTSTLSRSRGLFGGELCGPAFIVAKGDEPDDGHGGWSRSMLQYGTLTVVEYLRSCREHAPSHRYPITAGHHTVRSCQESRRPWCLVVLAETGTFSSPLLKASQSLDRRVDSWRARAWSVDDDPRACAWHVLRCRVSHVQLHRILDMYVALSGPATTITLLRESVPNPRPTNHPLASSPSPFAVT